MTTTKFIILATAVIAGSAAFYITRKKGITLEGDSETTGGRSRHLNPVFSKLKQHSTQSGEHFSNQFD